MPNSQTLCAKEMFTFSSKNLISSYKSGFKPGDSCVKQLLSVTYKICESLDNEMKVRSVFSDISKGFEKVWHESIIFKLHYNRIASLEN